MGFELTGPEVLESIGQIYEEVVDSPDGDVKAAHLGLLAQIMEQLDARQIHKFENEVTALIRERRCHVAALASAMDNDLFSSVDRNKIAYCDRTINRAIEAAHKFAATRGFGLKGGPVGGEYRFSVTANASAPDLKPLDLPMGVGT